jgi:hypothetical protein
VVETTLAVEWSIKSAIDVELEVRWRVAQTQAVEVETAWRTAGFVEHDATGTWSVLDLDPVTKANRTILLMEIDPDLLLK